MGIKASLSRHWPIVALVVLLAVVGLTAYLTPPASAASRVASVLWQVTPVAWAVLMYAYQRVDGFRLFMARAMAWVTNWEVDYALAATLEVEDSDLAMKSAEAHVAAFLGPDDVLLAEDGRTTAWSIRGAVLRVRRDDLYDGTPAIVAEWVRTGRSVRFWRTFLDLTAVPLLEEIARDPQVSAAKFVAQVHFDGPNPYFGALITHHAQEAVDSFRIRTHASVGSQRVSVDVAEDRMQVVGFNLRAVHVTSARYLGLTRAGGPR